MAQFQEKHITHVRNQIKQKSYEGAGFEEVATLAEVSADALKDFFEKLDTDICKELSGIVSYISEMKKEIGSLQAQDFKENRIPAAGHELDLVVQSTAQATNTIMEVAEGLMVADTSDHDAYVAEVNDSVMKIFEACSFQDLTGQRISKVVETLNAVETRLERFVTTLRVQDYEGFISDEERAAQERKKELILHGPQDKTEALKQNSVDDLFESLDGISAEDAIDSLFD